MAKMTEDQLRTVLDHELQQSVSWSNSTIREEQERNLQYYLGLPMGNEVEGRSQIISWDVFEIIESAMPGFIEPFFSGDNIGEFAPRQPDDEAFADQATDLVNYVIKDQNDGFILFNTWIKDGLLSKVGIVRASWQSQDPKKEEYENLTEEQVTQLVSDQAVTVKEVIAKVPEGIPPEAIAQAQAMGQQIPQIYDISIERAMPGRVKCENVRPEAFVISRGAKSVKTATLIGEMVIYTRSDLKEMGFDGSAEVNDYDDQAVLMDEVIDDIRGELPFRRVDGDSADPALEEIRLFRGFMKADYNGDGIAEYRRVLVGGNMFLENEEVEDQEYCVITPIPMPHRVIGMAYADPAADIQRLKTSLTRQFLDSVYLANNPRTYINTEANVNLDDLLNQRIGGIVRGKGPADQAFAPMQTTLVATESLEALQFADTMRETRLGITRYNQGLDAESLNKTAAGIQKIFNAADKRQAMTLRIMAETGIKDLFRLVLKLLCKHQDQEMTIRLRGEWVTFNPREWNPDMDVTIAVGIGSGDKTETLMMLQQFMLYAQQAALVGVIKPENVYEFGKMLLRNMKLKGAEDKLLSDPAKQPPQEPQPNPDMIKAQAEVQSKQAELQLKQQSTQADIQAKQQSAQIDVEKAKVELQIKLAELQIKQQELNLKAQNAQIDQQIRQQSAVMQASDDVARAQREQQKFDADQERQAQAHEASKERE